MLTPIDFPPCLVGALVASLHDARTTTGEHREAEIRAGLAHFPRQFVVAGAGLSTGGAEDGHAGSHEVQDTVGSDKIEPHPEQRHEVPNTASRAGEP
jgi:hypothetical protein